MIPLPFDTLNLGPQVDETGRLMFRLTDALELFGVSKGNVTFWASNIREQMPESVCKLVYQSTRNGIYCLYIDLPGLLYFALRAESPKALSCREWVVNNMSKLKLPPHGLDLGRPVQFDNREWYLFARVVNHVVHHERGLPRQTVTTSIKNIPKECARSIPQEDAKGNKLSKAGHVTAEGVIWYLMSANTPRANSYKKEVALAIARQYAPSMAYLGAA